MSFRQVKVRAATLSARGDNADSARRPVIDHDRRWPRGRIFGNLLSEPPRNELPPWRRYVAPFALGVIAAFATPLFLSLAESQLVERLIRSHPTYAADDIFVFGGFCLIAALSSRVFLDRLTEQLLSLQREVKALEKKTDEIDEEQEAIQETIADSPAQTGSAAEPSADGSPARPQPKISLPVHDVLRTLQARPTVWRSIGGLRKETNLSRETAGRLLDELVELGLADTKVGSSTGNRLYRATRLGLEFR